MKILNIDSQILTSFSHCPLRCHFGFGERLVTKDSNKYFDMGKVVHIGAQTYYQGIKDGKLYDERKKEALLTANTFAVTSTDLNQADLESTIKTLDQYFTYRREDKIFVKAVEVPFSKVLYVGKDLTGEDITILYEGIIDLIADEDGWSYVYDHKTTSKWYLQDPADLRVQFIGYSWATGYKVINNRIAFNQRLSITDRFKKFTFKYTEETVRRWESYAIRKGLQYARCLETNVWPEDFSACEGSHGYPCNFAEICRMPSLAEETKNYLFKVGEPWDVFSEKNT